MEKRKLTLVKRTKKRRWCTVILVLSVLLLLGVGGYYIAENYSIKDIKVSGNITYSEVDIITKVKEKDYVNNTLVMIALSKISHKKYLPFIDQIKMSYETPHVLKIKVKEGLRAGVFEYMGKNVYFDSDGIAMESREKMFTGVPVVTGVSYDKLVLGKKIPVKGNYFNTILGITKKISTYKLDISQIHFEGEDEIYLVSGNYQFYLGNADYLDRKMSKIPEILKAISKQYSKGMIDMHLCTDDKDIVTFREK